MNLAPCPQCGSTVHLVLHSVEDRLWCTNATCDWHGPIAKSRGEAVAIHNAKETKC